MGRDGLVYPTLPRVDASTCGCTRRTRTTGPGFAGQSKAEQQPGCCCNEGTSAAVVPDLHSDEGYSSASSFHGNPFQGARVTFSPAESSHDLLTFARPSAGPVEQ